MNGLIDLQVEAVTDRMPEAAVNLHGTRCVQKVVEVSESGRVLLLLQTPFCGTGQPSWCIPSGFVHGLVCPRRLVCFFFLSLLPEAVLDVERCYIHVEHINLATAVDPFIHLPSSTRSLSVLRTARTVFCRNAEA